MSGPRRRWTPAASPPWEPLRGRGCRGPSPTDHDGMLAMRSDQESLDLFRVYLDEVGRHPLLTKEDEIELSQAYEAGLDAQLKLADTSPDDPARP
ncbi:MAG TPA: sigma-70 factor domain-containing protein, partial [Actinomycetota bacterium]